MNLRRRGPKSERDWREAVPDVVAAALVVLLEITRQIYQTLPDGLRRVVDRWLDGIGIPEVAKEPTAEGHSSGSASPRPQGGSMTRLGDVVETPGGHGIY